MISLEKSMILAPLLKLPKNVGDLGKFIVAKSFKSCPKCKKAPTLVTLNARFNDSNYVQLWASFIVKEKIRSNEGQFLANECAS